ncbi:MAG: hypothetical protein U0822_22585 [Anaerolineae bacterium]
MRFSRHLRLIIPVLVVVAVVTTAVVALALPQVGSGIIGGFNRQGVTVDRTGFVGQQPALAVAAPESPNTAVPWVALAESLRGSNSQNIFVRSFDKNSGQWVTRGTAKNNGSLNIDTGAVAEDPAIALGGQVTNGHGTLPFVAWYEPVVTLQNKNNIFVSELLSDISGEFWQLTGDKGQRNPPSLNIDPAQNAEEPRIATGSVNAGATSFVPWVAWQENSVVESGKRQIFVSRGAPAIGPNILGGLQWIPTGKNVTGVGPSLNFDPANDATQPDIVFSGPNNTVPWTIWQEQDHSGQQISRIFASKAIADATALGNFRWDIQPACTGVGQNCALNRNFFRNAENPRIATGTLPEEDPTKPKPWAVWQEFDGQAWQIFVSRFDGTNWVPVGDSLNVFRFDNAETPDIYFVGNVPHVAWVEQQGGFKLLFVRHLADTRPGQERWDLDALPYRGINTAAFDPANRPALRGSATSPMVAWQENLFFNPNDLSVFEAKRNPDGPAWGSNRPPFIRVISGTREVAVNAALPLSDDKASAPDSEHLLGPQVIVTSCDHVNGWDNIQEIQTRLANDTQNAFTGRYVAAENKIYVEDPDNPGTWLGGIAPGTPGATITTKNVILHVDQVIVEHHGPGSPALDITWVLDFRGPTFLQTYTQLLNIIYLDELGAPQPTDFFAVGSINVVAAQIALPLIGTNATYHP